MSRYKKLDLELCIQIKDSLEKGKVIFLAGEEDPTTYIKILDKLGVKIKLMEMYNKSYKESTYDYKSSAAGWTQEEKKLIGHLIEKV